MCYGRYGNIHLCIYQSLNRYSPVIDHTSSPITLLTDEGHMDKIMRYYVMSKWTSIMGHNVILNKHNDYDMAQNS